MDFERGLDLDLKGLELERLGFDGLVIERLDSECSNLESGLKIESLEIDGLEVYILLLSRLSDTDFEFYFYSDYDLDFDLGADLDSDPDFDLVRDYEPGIFDK